MLGKPPKGGVTKMHNRPRRTESEYLPQRRQDGNRKGTVPFPEGGLSPFLGEKKCASDESFQA